MESYRLKVEHMSKAFPGVQALDDVRLSIKSGTVHAIVGENGAGKSTLMNCLFGLYHPDSGTIAIDGKEIQITDTTTALENGISMIHQELKPIPFLNVIDNIWIGRFSKKGIVVDEKEMRRKTVDLLADLNFDISPQTLAKDLSVSQLQAVEIAKAISYDAKIIIMDEATSSLTLTESEHLFTLIRRLKNEGRTVVYISHRLEEIFEIADEVTVMRDGKYIGTWDIEDVTIDQLINYMVGRDLKKRFPEKNYESSDEVILKVKDFTSADPKSFKDINFEVHKGEIFGIGGLVGSKRTELIESIFGLREIASGSLEINGKQVKNENPQEAIKNGFALLTEERRATGIIPMLTVEENVLVVSNKKYANGMLGYIRKTITEKVAQDTCTKLDVRTASIKTLIRNLSGGNQQKVLVGRWLLAQPNVLILDEPTRGVDVGAKFEIYKIMRELAKAGNAIIMVTSEMPELLGMSDRLAIMCEGRLAGLLDHDCATQVGVLKLATKFIQKSNKSI